MSASNICLLILIGGSQASVYPTNMQAILAYQCPQLPFDPLLGQIQGPLKNYSNPFGDTLPFMHFPKGSVSRRWLPRSARPGVLWARGRWTCCPWCSPRTWRGSSARYRGSRSLPSVAARRSSTLWWWCHRSHPEPKRTFAFGNSCDDSQRHSTGLFKMGTLHKNHGNHLQID